MFSVGYYIVMLWMETSSPMSNLSPCSLRRTHKDFEIKS